MKRDLKIFAILLALVFTTSLNAFKLLKGVYDWDITVEDPTIWVDFDPEFFEIVFEENEWEENGEENPLDSVAVADQVTEIFRLVLEDYNNIAGSFVRLNFRPTSGQSFPELSQSEKDSPYSEETAFKRLIQVKLIGTSGLSAGSARPVSKDESEYNCEIRISSSNAPRSLKRVLTHEIGHCMGLAHSHADKQAIMGYNSSASVHTLGVDDRMGILYLFPEDEKLKREVATFGTACSTSK